MCVLTASPAGCSFFITLHHLGPPYSLRHNNIEIRSIIALQWPLHVHVKWRVAALTGVAQLVRASSHKPKGLWFDFPPGHMPRLWVRSPVRVHMRQLIDVSLSHRCFSPSLPPFPPSLKINKHVLCEDKERKKKERKEESPIYFWWRCCEDGENDRKDNMTYT